MGFWGLGRLLGAVGAIGVLAGGGWLYAGEWRPSVEAYPVQGVDISDASGAVDWGVAAGQGVDFAYVLATDGVGTRDAAFERHWQALPVAGIRRGALHRFDACRAGAAQADLFNAVVPRTADALPVAVAFDLSDCATKPDRAGLVREVRAFLARVERHTGKPALLRVSPSFEKEYALASAIDRTVWAERTYLAPAYAPRGWRMWRASAMRRVDGFERPVSWSVVAS